LPVEPDDPMAGWGPGAIFAPSDGGEERHPHDVSVPQGHLDARLVVGRGAPAGVVMRSGRWWYGGGWLDGVGLLCDCRDRTPHHPSGPRGVGCWPRWCGPGSRHCRHCGPLRWRSVGDGDPSRLPYLCRGWSSRGGVVAAGAASSRRDGWRGRQPDRFSALVSVGALDCCPRLRRPMIPQRRGLARLFALSLGLRDLPE